MTEAVTDIQMKWAYAFLRGHTRWAIDQRKWYRECLGYDLTMSLVMNEENTVSSVVGPQTILRHWWQTGQLLM